MRVRRWVFRVQALDCPEESVSTTKQARRGFSLVEMVVVISVMSIIFGCVAVILHGMFRADQGARRELESNLNLDRLAARLRADAHAADTAEAQGQALSFKFAEERSVEYKFETARVERTVRQGISTTHFDSFRLPDDASVHWQAEQGGRPTVSALVESSAGKQARIEARVGTDHRFEDSKRR